MAKTMKDTVRAFDSDALRNEVRRINEAKARASEASGQAGQATKDACDRNNYDKTALTYIARLARKEPAQALQTLAASIVYGEAMGLFDQLDMFNDAVAAMKAVLDRAQNPPPAAGAAKVAQLAAGAH